MLDLDRRRFLFVTGKGGVGKSTVCAALALRLAAEGRRVLVAVTGLKERLSLLFGAPPVGTHVTEIAPRIAAVRLDPQVAIVEYGRLKLKSRALANAVFENRYVQGFFTGAPGLKEWAQLGKAWYHSIEEVDGVPRFDVVLFDAPATGHGLDMLRVPKVIVELSPPGPLRADAERAWRMFQDPARSGVVVVTLPEELPVNETEELVAALRGELGLPIAALVVNGVREQLFDPSARAVLAGLAASLPFADAPGEAAVAAGVRRAVREGVQAESRARLEVLGLDSIELPLLLGGVGTQAALGAIGDALARGFRRVAERKSVPPPAF